MADDVRVAGIRAARPARAGAGPLPSAALIAAGLLALAALLPNARAATYKWVDEAGVTHYSDKLPPEAVNRSSTVLNKQAVPVRKVDPAPSQAEVRARQAEAERREAEARDAEVQGRRDRALLQSYASEGEIDIARARSLATIDGQLQAAEAFLAALNKRREALASKKASAGEKSLPPAEEREFENATSEIAKQQVLIAQKRKERETAVAKYDGDKARWRELRAIADANRDAAAGTGPRTAAAASTTGSSPTTARR